ncbi:TMEM175 family protein [Sphingomonas daechungensis]|uniref:TMEM175 family protein n=2 Tax=Sphingomonas daechungensis TaxID=1176646 RepID=UPI0031E74704
MTPGRLNALTDGVVAIVLTIMVLELKFPEEPTFGAVLEVLPLLAAYLLAFIYVALYWNNHHHMLQSARRVTGGVLWANHSLLFCLTLFPLMIRWIDEAGVTPWPVASFGVVLAAAALTYRILQHALAAADGEGSKVSEVYRHPLKEYSSLGFYVAAILLAFVAPYLSVALYVIVAIIWIVPDRRFVGA